MSTSPSSAAGRARGGCGASPAGPARLLPHGGVELAVDQHAVGPRRRSSRAPSRSARTGAAPPAVTGRPCGCSRRIHSAQQREQQRGAAQHQHHFPAGQSAVAAAAACPTPGPRPTRQRRQDGRIAEGRHRGGAGARSGPDRRGCRARRPRWAAEERVVHRAVLSTRHLDARAACSLCHAPAALS